MGFLWFIMFGVMVNSCYYKSWHISQEGGKCNLLRHQFLNVLVPFHQIKSNISPIIQSLNDMEFNQMILLLIKAISVVTNNHHAGEIKSAG